MRRDVGTVLVVALGVGLLLLALHWQSVVVHLSQETGTSSGSSRAYDFWSGFGSDLAYIGVFVAAARHINCHNKGCWRLGTHTTPGGFKLCKKCVAKPSSDLRLHDIHDDHQ